MIKFNTRCKIHPTDSAEEVFGHKAEFIGKYSATIKGEIYYNIQVAHAHPESYTIKVGI